MEKCIFCQIIAGSAAAHIIYEDALCVVFLDKYPKTRGHLQLVPKTHYRWIYEHPQMGELFATAGRIVRGIIPVLKADHVTMSTFGHEVTHAHIWIVPQYRNREIIQEFGHQSKQKDSLEALAKVLRAARFTSG